MLTPWAVSVVGPAGTGLCRFMYGLGASIEQTGSRVTPLRSVQGDPPPCSVPSPRLSAASPNVIINKMSSVLKSYLTFNSELLLEEGSQLYPSDRVPRRPATRTRARTPTPRATRATRATRAARRPELRDARGVLRHHVLCYGTQPLTNIHTRTHVHTWAARVQAALRRCRWCLDASATAAKAANRALRSANAVSAWAACPRTGARCQPR